MIRYAKSFPMEETDVLVPYQNMIEYAKSFPREDTEELVFLFKKWPLFLLSC